MEEKTPNNQLPASSESKIPEYRIKIEDRVQRIGAPGCQGTVKSIRTEVTATGEAKYKSPMFVVFWDNGTQSYLAQDALQTVSS